MAEQLIHAFHDGKVISFVRADERSRSCFGGPINRRPEGISYGPRPLHMIASISLSDLGLAGRPFLWELPLIYGLSFSGCSITYSISGDKIEMLGLEPRVSSEDFPYDNYPLMLPYVPVKPLAARSATYDEFVDGLANPNLPDTQRTDLTVVVPPPATLGFSMWGSGDFDDVILIFEVDLKNATVHAYNQAT